MHLELLSKNLKAHEEIQCNKRLSVYLSHAGIQTQGNRNHDNSEHVLKAEFMLGTVSDNSRVSTHLSYLKTLISIHYNYHNF